MVDKRQLIEAGDTVAFHYSDCTVLLHAIEQNGVIGLIDVAGDFNPVNKMDRAEINQSNVEVLKDYTIPKGTRVERIGKGEFLTV